MKPNKQEPAPSNYPGSEQDSGWNFADVSVEASSPDKPSLRSKIGKLVVTFTDRFKEKYTDGPGKSPDDQDRCGSTSLDDLIETTLTPQQQYEARVTADKLARAIARGKGISSERLAKRVAAMEQSVRDCTIKRALALSQNKYARDPDELNVKVGFFKDMTINRVTEFMTNHRLFLENYDGLAETTASFLEKLPYLPMSVDEAPYAYFVNGSLNDEKVSKQVKSELEKRGSELDVSTISQDIIIDNFRSEPRDTRNLADFVKGLKNIGCDIASNDIFIEDCIDSSIVDDFHPDTIPLQDNLYRAGLINDDNIGRLYDRLIKDCSEYSSARNMHGLSLSLCPDSEVTRYWRQFRRTSQVGITSPSDRGITTESYTRSFRYLLDRVDQVHDNSDFGKYFRNGIPGQQYYNRLQGSPLLTNDNEVRKFVSCLGDMPLTPEIYSILGQSQVKALDMYKEWNEKRSPQYLPRAGRSVLFYRYR